MAKEVERLYLCKLHILAQQLALLERVIRIAGEIEVGKRSTWKHVTREHLNDRLSVELESGQTHLSSKKQHEDGRDDRRKKETPPRQSGLHIRSASRTAKPEEFNAAYLHHIQAPKSNGERAKCNAQPPPLRAFLVLVLQH